jgi:hypothetical protein
MGIIRAAGLRLRGGGVRGNRGAVAAFFVALGSTAIIFAAAGRAAAQTAGCDAGTCDSAPAQSADTSNGSGAVLVHDDGGSPTVSNGSGAVLVESDGGSPGVFNDSGAVVVEANGGSPIVSNDSGAVLVESEPAVRSAASGGPVFFPVTQFVPVTPFVLERLVLVAPLTSLPVTGAPVTEVVIMALVMIGIGAVLLATARFVPAFAATPPG